MKLKLRLCPEQKNAIADKAAHFSMRLVICSLPSSSSEFIALNRCNLYAKEKIKKSGADQHESALYVLF
jgi:hypothetical protein